MNLLHACIAFDHSAHIFVASSCMLQQFLLTCFRLLAVAAYKSGMDGGMLAQITGSWEWLSADFARKAPLDVNAHVPLHVQLADKFLATVIAVYRLKVFKATHMVLADSVHLGCYLGFKRPVALIALLNWLVLLSEVAFCIGVCFPNRCVTLSFVGFFVQPQISCSKVRLGAESARKDGLAFEQM